MNHSLGQKETPSPVVAPANGAGQLSAGVPSQTNSGADAPILIAGRPVWEVGQDIVRLMTRREPMPASVPTVDLAPEGWPLHMPSFVAGFVACFIALGSVAVMKVAGL